MRHILSVDERIYNNDKHKKKPIDTKNTNEIFLVTKNM